MIKTILMAVGGGGTTRGTTVVDPSLIVQLTIKSPASGIREVDAQLTTIGAQIILAYVFS